MNQIPHLGRSRIVKAITDANDSDKGFEQGTAMLDAVHFAVIIDAEQAATPAGQAAVLTAVVTAVKCFGSATLVCGDDVALTRRFRLDRTLVEAARLHGAEIAQSIPKDATHVVAIGQADADEVFVRCWWNGWMSGVLPAFDDEPIGNSDNPLAGIFAGALAVREVFAKVLGRRRNIARRATISLWNPWRLNGDQNPPTTLSLPDKLWFVGLGHLGQGFLWSLGFLPVAGGHAVLQDDQVVGQENVATGLLTSSLDFETENHKTRVAARWLEAVGWKTSILERRNFGDLRLSSEDPVIMLMGLDEPAARIAIAKGCHDFVLDAGVGYGAIDFEIAQIRVIPRGVDPETLWSRPAAPKNVDAVLDKPAYREHARKHGNCGTYSLAEASVAVPFVGAAIGALTIAQLLRLAALRPTNQISQVELGTVEAASAGVFNPVPGRGLGGFEFSFA